MTVLCGAIAKHYASVPGLLTYEILQERRGSKHRGAAKKNGGSLAFLPEPQNPIPVRDDPAPGPSNEPTTSTIEFFPTTETAEMYRMTDAETGPQSAAAGPSTAQYDPTAHAWSL